MRRYLGAETTLSVLLAVSASMNLALGYRIYADRTAARQRQIERATLSQWHEGDNLGSFPATPLGGQSGAIDFNGQGRPRVLYVFSPRCHWCVRNEANVRAIAAGAGERYEFVGICSTYCDDVRPGALPFPIFRISEAVGAELRMRGTPQTIVVSPDGKILKSWNGAYHQSKADVERFFQVTLPGLVEPAAAVSSSR